MNYLFPTLQSSYRKFHSTRSVHLKVKKMTFYLTWTDSMSPSLFCWIWVRLLMPLIMESWLKCLGLHLGFRIRHSPGLHLYLSDRTLQVSIDSILSTRFDLECGEPECSCFGRLLFVVYASKIFEVVCKHNLEFLCYVEGSQLHVSFCPKFNTNQEAALARIKRCIKRQIGTSQKLAKVSITSLHVGTATITSVSPARNLGSWFDSKVTMVIHI